MIAGAPELLMQIRMRAFRVMQDAGRELPLHVDRVYDLSDVVAAALIATGAAEPVRATLLEVKPFPVPERKGRRA